MATQTGITLEIDKRELERLIRETPGHLSDLVEAAAAEVQGDIVLSFGTGPAGRSYKSESGSVTHVASSPGFPPNVDTGALRASIRTNSLGPLSAEIVAGTEYAVELEYGRARVAARPFFTPVAAEWQQGRMAAFAREFGILP